MWPLHRAESEDVRYAVPLVVLGTVADDRERVRSVHVHPLIVTIAERPDVARLEVIIIGIPQRSRDRADDQVVSLANNAFHLTLCTAQNGEVGDLVAILEPQLIIRAAQVPGVMVPGVVLRRRVPVPGRPVDLMPVLIGRTR